MIFYGETEFQGSPIGKIPKDWEVTTLSDASLLVTDGSHFSPKHQSSGYPLATVANMRENNIDVDSCYRITKEDYAKLATTGDKPEVNDVLFSKDGTVGQCIVFNQKVDLIVLSSIAIIRPNSKKANPYFLKYMLQSPSTLGRITGSKTGSAIKRIILRDLNLIKIALPKELEEQKRIVEVLGVVDSAIELANKVIAKTERLKKGFMQQLLTRGIGHTEYKAIKEFRFEIPKEWNVVSIYDIKANMKGAIVSGPFGSNIGKRFFVKEGVPLIRGNNLTKGEKLFIDDGFVFVTEEKAEQEKSCTALPNDLIFTAAGTLGQVGLIPKNSRYSKYIISNKQLRARIDTDKALPLFLFYWFSSSIIKELIKNKQTGTSIPVINLSILRSLPVLLPDISEQQKIIEILSYIDKRIEFERKEKAVIERVKAGFMDLLLTGKVRIKVD